MALVVPSRPLGRSSCETQGWEEHVRSGLGHKSRHPYAHAPTPPPPPPHARTHLRELGQVLPHLPQPLGQLRARGGRLQVRGPERRLFAAAAAAAAAIAARGRRRGPVARHWCVVCPPARSLLPCLPSFLLLAWGGVAWRVRRGCVGVGVFVGDWGGQTKGVCGPSLRSLRACAVGMCVWMMKGWQASARLVPPFCLPRRPRMGEKRQGRKKTPGQQGGERLPRFLGLSGLVKWGECLFAIDDVFLLSRTRERVLRRLR